MTTTLLLIRHAAHEDLDIRLSGRRAGVTLSAAGKEQATALGVRLCHAGITRVVCSPLDRTRDTAAALAQACELPAPTPVDALTELDMGDWTGRTLESLHGDPAWIAWNAHREVARVPGGETMAEAQARIVGWMTEAAATSGDETVAAVTHSDIIRAAVAHVLGLPLDKLLRFDIDPASITTMVMGDWGAKLVRLNEKGA